MKHEAQEPTALGLDQNTVNPRKPRPLPKSGIEIPADLGAEYDLFFEEVDAVTGQVDEKEDERRKFQRLQREALVDQDILIFVNNLNTSVNSRDQLLDLSASGLLLLSHAPKDLEDVLLLEFRIGTMRFKLKGRVKRRKDQIYGVEFVNPPEETVDSIEQLYGSARLNKPRRGHHKFGS